MEQELTNVESVEIEQDRVEGAEEETTDLEESIIDKEEAIEEEQPPLYTREQMLSLIHI